MSTQRYVVELERVVQHVKIRTDQSLSGTAHMEQTIKAIKTKKQRLRKESTTNTRSSENLIIPKHLDSFHCRHAYNNTMVVIMRTTLWSRNRKACVSTESLLEKK